MKAIGLSEAELRERQDRLGELHILPEHRVQLRGDPEGLEKSPGGERLKRNG